MSAVGLRAALFVVVQQKDGLAQAARRPVGESSKREGLLTLARPAVLPLPNGEGHRLQVSAVLRFGHSQRLAYRIRSRRWEWTGVGDSRCCKRCYSLE